MELAATRPWICLALALLPGIVRWLSGRRVLARRRAGSPFPDVPPTGGVAAFDALSLAVAIVLVRDRPLAILGLLVVWEAARLGGAFPLRRARFGETWSLWAYLAFGLETRLVMQLAWLGLLAAPAIVLAAAPADRGPVAGLVVAALLVLFYLQRPLLRRALRARPSERAELLARCAEILARSRVAAAGVRVYEGGPPGGHWANALALPSVRAPGVLFARPLLDALSPAEAAAIFAHEVAHLEHFDALRLRRSGVAATLLVVAGAVMLPVLAQKAGEGFETVVPLLWAGGLLIGMGLKARRRRAQETASDLRALALGADPEALISGLTKTHALAGLARRWDPELERRATHPSLARRIQDLRRSAGLTAPRVPQQVVTTPDGTVLELGQDALVWLAGVPADLPRDATPEERRARAARSAEIRYERLAEARVVWRGSEPFLRLVAASGGELGMIDADSGRAGRRAMPDTEREIALSPASVPLLDMALDAVDARLGTLPPPGARRWWGRLLGAAAIAAVALPGGSWALVAAGIAAWLAPASAAAAAALAAVGAGTALLLWRTPPGSGATSIPAMVAAVVIALGGLVLVRRGERQPNARRDRLLRLWLGIAWAWAWAVVAAAAVSTVALHVALRASPGAALAPLACAAALAVGGARRVAGRSVPAWLAAAIPGLGSALALWLGSAAAGGLWTKDPLLVAAAVPPVARTLAAERGFEVAHELDTIVLAPDGEHYLATSDADEDGEPTTALWLGGLDGSAARRLPSGFAGIFLDARTVLALRGAGDGAVGAELAALAIDAPETPRWTAPASEVGEYRLEPGAGPGSFCLVSLPRGGSQVLVRRGDARGVVGVEEKWTVPSSGRRNEDWIALPNGVLGLRRLDPEPRPAWRPILAGLAGAGAAGAAWEAVLLRDGGSSADAWRSELLERCLPADGGALCLSRGDGMTGLWRVSSEGPRLLAAVPGDIADAVASAGATGERVLFSRADGSVELLALPGERIALRGAGEPAWPRVALSAHRAVVATVDAVGTRLEIYSLPPLP